MAAPALALQAAPELKAKAKRIGELFAHQFGLTEEHEYLGWKVALGLAFLMWQRNLKGPVKTAWVIEQQLVGVLEQLYTWLGGSGPGGALGKGIVTLTGPGLVYEAVTDPWGTAAYLSGAGLIYETGQSVPPDAQVGLEVVSPLYDFEAGGSWVAQHFHL